MLHAVHMGSDGLARVAQFFQQGVAKELQMHLCPQRAQRTEHGNPVFGLQCVPQRVRRAHKGGVLVKNRQCVARDTALRTDAVAGDLLRLQLIQAVLGARVMQPAQAVEKIMQTVARRNLAVTVNECLIGLAGREGGLHHKLHARIRRHGHRCCVQRLRAVGTCVHLPRQRFSHGTQWGQPGRGPVNRR